MNLPAFFANVNRLLIVGCGGGWDFAGGIPIAEFLTQKVIFANYSSHWSDGLCTDDYEEKLKSVPEGIVDEFLNYKFYVIGHHGVKGVRRGIQQIVDKEGITDILVIDGGVDALMHGDEIDAGTFLEDTITLTAVNRIQGVNKYFASLGMGTETEEGLNHYRALENISLLMSQGAFLGSCALTKESEEYRTYKEIVEKAVAKGAPPSHIQTKIIAAVDGQFGNVEMNYNARLSYSCGDVFINPLMSLYWFFDLAAIVGNNKLSSMLEHTNTYTDAVVTLRANIDIMNKREHLSLPL